MNRTQGFTLVELLVSLTIIGILSSIVFATFSSSQAQARDQQRQVAVKEMQLAMERYYNQNGFYPELGTDSDCNFEDDAQQADSTACENYIEGLVPDYIDELPGANSDYQYKYQIDASAEPSEYKFTATGIEVLEVDSYDHPFSYCPRPVDPGHICNASGPPPGLYAVYSRNGWGL